MNTHDFIRENPKVGKLGLYRIHDVNMVARMAAPAHLITNEILSKEVEQVLYEMQAEAYHLIIDLGNILHFSRDAHNWMKTEQSKEVILSYALVADNPITAFLASMALKASRLSMPHAVFRKFENARSWTAAHQESLSHQKAA